jgi:hypothetical protein
MPGPNLLYSSGERQEQRKPNPTQPNRRCALVRAGRETTEQDRHGVKAMDLRASLGPPHGSISFRAGLCPCLAVPVRRICFTACGAASTLVLAPGPSLPADAGTLRRGLQALLTPRA